MEPLEQLKGQDSFKYLGVPVSITMATGDTLKGELYCLDQRGQTLILRSEKDDENYSLHILRLSSIIKFEPLGKLNDSMYDIPRISYDELCHVKSLINRHEDGHPKRNH